jgi:acylpyruvate hydrolase
MKLATIRLDDRTTAVRLEGDEAVLLPYGDVGELLATSDWQAAALRPEAGTVRFGEVDYAPLIPAPEKIICVGINYPDHIEEVGAPQPEVPTFFAKYHRSLIGACDRLALPGNSDAVDWEVELVAIIGRPVRHVTPARALEAVAGYTIMNDISMRDWQLRTSQFLQGKTFEASTPLGPILVTPDEVDHARDLEMSCTVNGEVMQQATTASMVFSVAEVIAYLSDIITLVPGDVIATGTPGGIGGVRTPPRYLGPGDTVTTAVEGLGSQSNVCVAAQEADA